MDRGRRCHPNAASHQETRKSHFVHVLGKGQYGRYHEDGVGADDNRYFEVFPAPLRFPVVSPTAFHTLPVHSGRALIEDLHAIQTEVSTLRLRMSRDDATVGDESSRITRPALNYR